MNPGWRQFFDPKRDIVSQYGAHHETPMYNRLPAVIPGFTAQPGKYRRLVSEFHGRHKGILAAIEPSQGVRRIGIATCYHAVDNASATILSKLLAILRDCLPPQIGKQPSTWMKWYEDGSWKFPPPLLCYQQRALIGQTW